ncbi:MAG: hypothetical protein ACTHM2_05110 [Afipia sp.]
MAAGNLASSEQLAAVGARIARIEAKQGALEAMLVLIAGISLSDLPLEHSLRLITAFRKGVGLTIARGQSEEIEVFKLILDEEINSLADNLEHVVRQDGIK